MNIFENKKQIAMTLIFVMFMALVQQPLLTAKERRGATVVVTMTDGRMVRGELLAVKSDALLIYDQDAGQGKSLDLQQVTQVKLLKKSKILKGIAIGLGVGVGLSALYHATTSSRQAQEYAALTFFCVPPIIGLCGGILGAFSGLPEKFSLAGASPRSVQQNLERLKRYAREQDDAELAVPTFAGGIASPSGFWHRFRLLWLPVQQHFNRRINFAAEYGTFRFLGNAPLKDTALYEFKLGSRSYLSDQLRVDRLRLEYELSAHFSASLEFIASGKVARSVVLFDLSYYSIDYGKRYKSYISIVNQCLFSPLLLGLNWRPISPSFARKHVFELGIAACPVRAQLNADYFYTQNSDPLIQFKTLTWSCKLHAAYDHFYTDHFSLGIFVAYQYLRASFPGATFANEKQDFWSEDIYRRDPFTRPTEFSIPALRIKMDDTAYGLRVGLHF